MPLLLTIEYTVGPGTTPQKRSIALSDTDGVSKFLIKNSRSPNLRFHVVAVTEINDAAYVVLRMNNPKANGLFNLDVFDYASPDDAGTTNLDNLVSIGRIQSHLDEAWDVFTINSEKCILEIQSVDEIEDGFCSDLEAVGYVFQRALVGDEAARQAIHKVYGVRL